MDATKQTAAGLGLVVLAAAPLDLGDLEPFGLLEWLGLRDPFFLLFLPGFLLFFESLLAERAGVACRGFPEGPSWENLQSAPRSHLPCFQNLQTLVPLPFGLGEPERSVERPLDLLGFRFLSRGLGVSCLYGQFSLLQPPLFHATQ